MKKILLLLFLVLAIVSTVVAQEKITVKGNLKKVVPILFNNMENGFAKLVKPSKESIENLAIMLENEPNIAKIEVKWVERFGKKNRVIVITWKKSNSPAFVIQEQKEIVNLVIENFKDFDVDLTENRLVSYVKNEEPIVAYSAIFTSNTNEKCYVQSIVNSDYSNRAKPIFNNQLSFFSCN
jgi:hypothetical protein